MVWRLYAGSTLNMSVGANDQGKGGCVTRQLAARVMNASRR